MVIARRQLLDATENGAPPSASAVQSRIPYIESVPDTSRPGDDGEDARTLARDERHGALDAAVGRVNLRDCVELMNSLPAESVQMVFADPPFNLDKKYASYNDRMAKDDYKAWTGEWLDAALRTLAPDGSLFVYNIPRLLIETVGLLDGKARFRHWIAWNAAGKPLGKTLQPAHYGILYYTKGDAAKFYDVRAPHPKCRACNAYHKDYGGKEARRHPFGFTVSDVWDDIHRVRHNSKRIDGHPCQLPPHLVERVILMATDEGDVVLDPFAGGGSAGIAAKRLGRRYVGAEIDPGYAAAAQQRCDEASPTKRNGAYVSVHLGKVVSARDKDAALVG